MTLYTILPLPILFGAWHIKREGGRRRTIRCAILCVKKIPGGEIKETSRANNRID